MSLGNKIGLATLIVTAIGVIYAVTSTSKESITVTTGNNTNSQINVGNKETNIYNDKVETTIIKEQTIESPKKKLTFKPNIPSRNKYFKGREDKLKELEDILKKDNKALIYGIGGTGKTSLIKEYIYRKKLKDVYFLELDAGLETALLQLVAINKLTKKDNLVKLTTEELDKKQNYIILDNAKLKDKREIEDFINSFANAKVVVTSRSSDFDIAEQINLTELSDSDAKLVFDSYFKRAIEPQEQKYIDEIIKLTGNIPLVIEIMAKHTKYYMSAKAKSLKEIVEFYKKNNLDKSVPIKLSKDSSTKQIQRHIQKIFNLDNIATKEQKELLTALANLNPSGVEIWKLNRWIDYDKNYINASIYLEQIGWLQNRNNEKLKIHRIVKEVVNQNIKQPKTIDSLIDSLTDQLTSKALNNNNLNGKKYLLDVKELIKNDLKTKEFATLLNNLSLILQALGDFNEAKKYQLKTIEIEKKVLEPSLPSLAKSYNNLSMILSDLGDFNEAKKYQLKATQIWEKVLEPSHPDLATSYNNLSSILLNLEDFNEAKKYQLKTIEIEEKVLEPSHPSLATSYNNLSLILQDLGDLNEAKKYQLKTIEIKEKALEPSHPNLAVSYKNMAILYYKMKDYKEAKVWIDKCYEIEKNIYKESHFGFQDTLMGKKMIESKL